MNVIQSAKWINDGIDYGPRLFVTFQLPQELVQVLGSYCELDMKSECGKIIFDELEAYMKDHNMSKFGP